MDSFLHFSLELPLIFRSGISWRHIAIASEYPSVIDAPNPDPIANPSGKLWSANPTLTIIPVFNNELLLYLEFLFMLNFFWTNISHIIIITIPAIIPNNTFDMFDIAIASGIKSKHTIASINPDANDNIKLKNLFDGFFTNSPIIPPIVVPNVPKNSPINVSFIKFSKFYTSLY